MSKLPFIIGYWGAPPPEPARYEEAARCGFSCASAYTDNPEEGRLFLDLAYQAGMKMVIYDLRIDVSMPDKPGWEAIAKQVIDDYRDHPALYGYFIDDEPHQDEFANNAKLAKLFREYDPEHIAYFNLYPSYAGSERLGAVDFQNYVADFVCKVQPSLLSYDHYPFLEGGIVRENYFSDMLVIRQYALQADIPYVLILQTTPELNLADPTQDELRWQVYTALAHGYRGLVYFSYWTEEQNNARNSIIDIYGMPTWKYQVVRNINYGLRALLPHLERLTSVAVYHWPNAEPGVPILIEHSLIDLLRG